MQQIRALHKSGIVPFRLSFGDQPMERVNQMVFSPDGRFVCTGNDNPHIKSYGGILSVTDRPNSIAEESIASARLWDLATGREVRRFLGHHAWNIASLAFSPDGKLLATTGYRRSGAEMAFFPSFVARNPGHQVRIWEVATGEELHRWDGIGGNLSFSSDGRSLVATSSTGGIYVMDPKTGKKLHQWKRRCSNVVPPIPLSRGNQMLVVIELGGNITVNGHTPAILDLETGDVTRRFVSQDSRKEVQGELYNTHHIVAVSLSHDKKRLATAGDLRSRGSDGAGSVIVWDFQTASEIRRFSVPRVPQSLQFGNEGTMVTGITDEGVRQRWDIETGDLIFEDNLGAGNQAFSPDGRLLAVAGSDDEQGYWDLLEAESAAPIARFHQLLEERQWSSETSNGFYVTSTASRPAETTQASTRSLSEPVFEFNVPAPPLKKENSSPASDDDQRPAEITESRLDPAHVALTLADALGLNLTGHRANGVTIVGISSDPSPSAPGRKPNSANQQTRGKLFVLTVGVSKYKFPEYRLRFAKKDADDLAQFFRGQNGRAFEDIFVQVYTDRNATRENLETGLDWLARSCTPEDTAVVLFAGHGVTKSKGLYFLTWEADVESIANTCLNWDRVAEPLTRTKAKRIVFFADCCHSGAFSEEHYVTQEKLAEKLGKQTNLTIVCSSSGTQASFENVDWGNGAFTKSLIEGLRGYADTGSKDGRITLSELLPFVSRRVNDLTNRQQTPQVFSPEPMAQDFLLSIPTDP